MKHSPNAAVEAYLISTGNTAALAKMKREGLKKKWFSGSNKPIVIDDRPKDVIPQVTAPEQDVVTVPLLCFPLQAWLEGSPDLPKDIQTLDKTGKALKEHVRPDGAVFLGLFEVPNGKGTGVVVFGDKGTPNSTAIAVSQQYRDEVMEEIAAVQAGRKAALESPAANPLVQVS